MAETPISVWVALETEDFLDIQAGVALEADRIDFQSETLPKEQARQILEESEELDILEVIRLEDP